VLVADKGEPGLASMPRGAEPRVQRHGGGVAAMVNFDAVRAWWGWRPFLASANVDPELGFYALAQGLLPSALPFTRAAWAATLGTHSPLEELRALDALLETPQPAIALLSTLEDWGFDPDVFVRMAEPLRALSATLGPAACAALVEAVDRTWANHFELGGAMDVAFEMATVLHRAGQLTHAVRFYERSLASHGRHATVCFNLALCRLDLGDRDGGAALLNETLALEPAHAGAMRILASL
jgi:tetratricopeptide (TPR) repeat protein